MVSAEATLSWVDLFCSFQLPYQSVIHYLLHYLTWDRCQCDWSVVLWVLQIFTWFGDHYYDGSSPERGEDSLSPYLIHDPKVMDDGFLWEVLHHAAGYVVRARGGVGGLTDCIF